MAAKIASDKKAKKDLQKKHLCADCTGTMQAVKFAGFGVEQGMYWVCMGITGNNGCGKRERTGN